MATIGERIKEARDLRGLTQAQLAEKVECSPARIKDFERLTDEAPTGSRFFDSVLRELGLEVADSVTIGERIRRARQLKHLTHQQLADEVGCSLALIKSYEKRTKPPRQGPNKFFDQALQVLGISLAAPESAEIDWTDPPVSLANKEQLVTALYQRIYAESGNPDQSSVEPFGIEDLPESGQRRRNGRRTSP